MKDDVDNVFKAKRGNELPQSKLNEKLVRMIREEHENKQREIARLNKDHSAKAIAKRYQVHYRTIEKVLEGSTWSHI